MEYFLFQIDGIHVILNSFNLLRDGERESWKYHLTKQFAFIFDGKLVKYYFQKGINYNINDFSFILNLLIDCVLLNIDSAVVQLYWYRFTNDKSYNKKVTIGQRDTRTDILIMHKEIGDDGYVWNFGNMPQTITPHRIWILNGPTFVCLEGRVMFFLLARTCSNMNLIIFVTWNISILPLNCIQMSRQILQHQVYLFCTFQVKIFASVTFSNRK